VSLYLVEASEFVRGRPIKRGKRFEKTGYAPALLALARITEA